MQTNANSSPETAGPGSGEGNAPAGRQRGRGWRPHTTRAKAGLAAVAAVAATALGLALAVGPAGASTKPVWAMTTSNVQTLSGVDASTASYFFNTSAAYGNGASLVRTPVQSGYATTPVC
jgi:ABC-type phosphate transport system substrate-binding protein